MIHATSSPIVAYVYVYALPATGMIRRELGVAEARERAPDGGDREAQRHGGPGSIGGGGSGADEEPRSDDGADAERDELEGPERSLKARAGAPGLPLGEQLVERLSREQFGHRGLPAFTPRGRGRIPGRSAAARAFCAGSASPRA